MTTQYPISIDVLTNPNPSDKLNNPSHSSQHANANDAIEAIETYLGTASSTGTSTITGRVVALEAGGGGGSGTVTSVTATAPLIVFGTTDPNISIPVASVSVDGYLSASSFQVFNNKANANGSNATGSWPIDISGVATSVDDLNSATSIKQWIGTQAQYDALGTWDSDTFYTITDATSSGGGGAYLPLAGGVMTGPIEWDENSQTGSLDMIVDPFSSTGDVLQLTSDSGTVVSGPYLILDSTNLQMTMPGAQLNAALTVAAIDSFGVVSLGYTVLPPPSYAVTDTTTAPVVIKSAGSVPPTAWISLGLDVTLAQDIPAGTGNIGFEGIFANTTSHSGTVEFGLRINGSTIKARELITQISPSFYQTVGLQLPLLDAYVAGDSLELIARVTSNNNNNFALTMANSVTDLGAMRVYTTGSSGGSGTGAVDSVGGVAPIVSSGGSNPQISIPPASGSQSGYLSAASFTTFSNKQNPETTLAGYGITDAYTKTQVDASLANKQALDADLTAIAALSGTAGFLKKTATDTWSLDASNYSLTTHTHTTAQITGLDSALAAKAPLASPALTGTPTAPTATVNTNTTQLATTAYVIAQIADDAPTKTGTGATGSWGINVTGSSASCTGNSTTATTATTATNVTDMGAGATLKLWYGTEAEYTAIGTKDPTTLYFRSA